MRCVDRCAGTALRSVGEYKTLEQIMERIVRYTPFFNHSERGGVTLSGGEPSFQPEFSLQLIEACKELGILTAMETCGYARYDTLKTLVEACDLVLYDIKHMDDTMHRQGTGKSNALILENLRRLDNEVETEIVVRVPLIPGFNDDEENIKNTVEYVTSRKRIERFDLLPFNELPSGKYKAMGMQWEYASARRQTQEALDRLIAIPKSHGLNVTIGGLW